MNELQLLNMRDRISEISCKHTKILKEQAKLRKLVETEIDNMWCEIDKITDVLKIISDTIKERENGDKGTSK
jgi:hypothetical protein